MKIQSIDPDDNSTTNSSASHSTQSNTHSSEFSAQPCRMSLQSKRKNFRQTLYSSISEEIVECHTKTAATPDVSRCNNRNKTLL